MHQFDELTKSMAQSVTRRAALKKFGVGLAGVVPNSEPRIAQMGTDGAGTESQESVSSV